MLDGLGFQVWLIDKLPDLTKIVKFVQYYNVKWISYKLAQDSDLHNDENGAFLTFEKHLQVLTELGVDIGMWQFLSGRYPTESAITVLNIFSAFKNKGLKFLQVDAEDGIWNEAGAVNSAKTYLNKLTELPANIIISLNSYRYISSFPSFPFGTFLAHSQVSEIHSQLYWEFSHNPEFQLEKSLQEYRNLSAKKFVPMFPVYFRGIPETQGSWGPTEEDMLEFIRACNNNNLTCYGGFRLEKVFEHYDTYGYKWMRGLTGKENMNLVPEPSPVPQPTIHAIVTSYALNVRSSPWGSIVTTIPKNFVLTVEKEVLDSNKRSWYKLHGGNFYVAAWYTDVYKVA